MNSCTPDKTYNRSPTGSVLEESYDLYLVEFIWYNTLRAIPNKSSQKYSEYPFFKEKYVLRRKNAADNLKINVIDLMPQQAL